MSETILNFISLTKTFLPMSLARQRVIISKLRRTPMSFEEIEDYLQLQSEITGEDLYCSHRTFQRDIKRIEKLFKIKIKHISATGKYEIVYDEQEEHNERLMEAYEVFNALNISDKLSRHIILEKRKPLGTEHLHGLLHAIKTRREISFDYEKYYNGSHSKRRLKPLVVKEARNRWYLIGEDLKDGKIKSFGLDRLSRFEITNRKFEKIDYDPEDDYRYAFGIINGTNEKPRKVVLSFTPTQGQYIKSLPLHHTQNLVLENEKEVRFEYKLYPTHDFKMEVLSYGPQVKVLEPAKLKKEIRESLKKSLEAYP